MNSELFKAVELLQSSIPHHRQPVELFKGVLEALQSS